MRRIEHRLEGLELPTGNRWRIVLGLFRATTHADVKGAPEIRFGWTWYTARQFVPTLDSVNRLFRKELERSSPLADISYLGSRFVRKQSRRYLCLTIEVTGEPNG